MKIFNHPRHLHVNSAFFHYFDVILPRQAGLRTKYSVYNRLEFSILQLNKTIVSNNEQKKNNKMKN
jgi:hypothetical protein